MNGIQGSICNGGFSATVARPVKRDSDTGPRVEKAPVFPHKRGLGAKFNGSNHERFSRIVIQAVVDRCIYAVSREFGEPIRDLMGRRRFQSLALARMVFYYVSKRSTRLGYYRLSWFLKRDHTTIIHGVRRVEQRMVEDREFAARVVRVALAVMGSEAVL